MKLPRIYPITDRLITGLSHADQVRQLIAGGASLIQLREKHGSSLEFFKDADAAIAIARMHGVRILINDRVDIALALRADGVHLGQDDLPPREARRILGERAIIGLSTRNAAQAAIAATMPVDYIAIGPIFSTATKQNSAPQVGIDGVRRVREAVGDVLLAAIGGINTENFRDVFAAGADSIAVISGILSPPDTIAENLAKFTS